jgi:hypothetical protein
MPYMLLIMEPLGQRATRTLAEGQAQMVSFGDGLKARGLLRATESLRSHNDGARVEVRGGRARVTDGPFAEAKEMVGGFFLLDCETRVAM